MIQIFSNGTIYWALTFSSTGLCRVTTRFFPYDRHRCGIVFSPESYLNVFFRPMFHNVIVSPGFELLNFLRKSIKFKPKKKVLTVVRVPRGVWLIE